MKRLKMFFITNMGTAGGMLFFILFCIFIVFPTVMLSLPVWVSLIVFLLFSFGFTFVLDIWYIIGFFGAINGPQDVLAVIFYVLFGLIMLLDVIPSLIRLGIILFDRDR